MKTRNQVANDNDSPGSLDRLVRRLGEFTDAKGIVRQCRVTGLADEGYEELKGLITIDYCRDGEKIIGAVIGADEFRPDSPNE